MEGWRCGEKEDVISREEMRGSMRVIMGGRRRDERRRNFIIIERWV